MILLDGKSIIWKNQRRVKVEVAQLVEKKK